MNSSLRDWLGITMISHIDLNDARIPPTSEVLSGRDCGEEFRRKFRLDAEDTRPDFVTVSIPDDVVSMNTSFFLGLFGASVRRLGPEGFLEKYHFVCDEVHMATVREGIARAIKEHTIFPQKKKQHRNRMRPTTVLLFGVGLPRQLASLPCPPRVIFQDASWWQPYVPSVVGFLQFVLLAVLTFFIFWSNATQKIRERQAEWYHKVVVDHAISSLKALFGDMQKRLLIAADEVEKLRTAGRMSEARNRSKVAIGDAKSVIFTLRSEMGFRLAAFDDSLEQGFTAGLELLENELVTWFTSQPDRHSYDASESLPTMLSRGQVRLLRHLMTHEFTTWGFYLPWSRKVAPSASSPR